VPRGGGVTPGIGGSVAGGFGSGVLSGMTVIQTAPLSLRLVVVFLLCAGLGVACGGGLAVGVEELPPGPDVTEPFPIDRGDDGAHTPGTYKGLPLRLADAGEPVVTAVDGVIGVVCVGMSNAQQECDAFVERVRGPWAGEVDPRVRVANCAVGGHAIERWNDPAFDDRLWDACRNVKLAAAGIRADQVRVLYHKAANQFTTGPNNLALPLYPHPDSDYERFLSNLAIFAARVPAEFPSAQAVYTSSRSYGGYAPHPGRGEPLSYEEGHALNSWLRHNPTVGGVWHGWGPYLWAPDCATGVTNGAGLCYVRADYVEDGVHPSADGRAKIARAVHDRLLQHAWYRR
jgi:hypothetical protein